jgi:flagellar basal-body rod protein FlgC
MSGDMFGAITTSGTSLHVYKTWMDAISDNVANINTARPTSGPAFQQRFVIAQSMEGGANGVGTGTQVAGIAYGDPNGRLVYDPQSPIADASGMVRYPDVDLGEQMTSMILAQRGYQANLAVVDRAKDAYSAALELGK